MEKIKPTWSAQMRFPRVIRLPVQIANVLHPGQREITIQKPEQDVPALVIQWMQGDPRYRTWLLQATTQPDPVADDEQPEFDMTLKTGAATDEPREHQGETLHAGDEAVLVEDKPKRGRRKKAADEE